MQKITSKAELQVRIRLLEEKQAAEWDILKSAIVEVREELRPLNIIKRTLREITFSSTDKNDLLATAMGATAGVLSKTVLFGFSHNPIKKIVGALLQLKVGSIVANQSDNIKKAGKSLINFLIKRKV